MNKKQLLTSAILIGSTILGGCQQAEKPQYKDYDQMPVYKGTDLGITYHPDATAFKLWSPAAEEVKVNLYDNDLGGKPTKTYTLEKGEQDVWSLSINEDLKGKYYTFEVKSEGKWLNETPGIYAKAVGTNGLRGMIVDMASTNPEGWENDTRPPLKNINDIILYELHVRDITISENAGSQYPGKFLGLAESGLKGPEGVSTGLDHIAEMGVTHVHILPAFDYKTIDESKLDQPQYNWGYDPQNYNVPEGSYSTDPADGAVRIKEFKQMVKAMHDKGLRVVLDVVYNHTFDRDRAYFNQELPGYYYRHWEDGKYSDASACGNETASDRAMMRKYMIESVLYWAKEYHLDGFRFDLMGIHDIETMNQLTAALKEVDPSIYVYGEGWTASDSPLPVEKRALKAHMPQMGQVAAFSDDMRDAIKGHWSEEKGKGFVSGKEGTAESVKFGIVASTQHPDVNYAAVNYSKEPWANEPAQTINYVSCHDNHTLYDKLKVSNEEASEEEIKKMHKLSNAIVLTSQGIPFLHAGVEMMRTKFGVENSYNSPDSINRIRWEWKVENKDVVDYYKGLIAVRKAHPAFRMPTAEMIQKHLKFMSFKNPLTVGYTIEGHANGDKAEQIMVIFNGNKGPQNLNVPKGRWLVIVDDKKADPTGVRRLEGGNITVPGRTALVMVK
ncbi:type I pullulanase [Limibacter armeniacum]|uniref:type I pullulanase n=1 Tax=Limibacter armeniacum TaxID=466084 RepID=UPI002FE677AE